MKATKPLTGIGVVILAGTLAACGNKTTTATKTTWNRMATAQISTMDPSTNTDMIGIQALNDTMEGLYRYHGNKLVGGVAKSVVKATDNGLTYTFHLRKSTWSNGKPVTAQDFVYAWKRTVNPATKAQYAYLYSGIKNADAIMAGKKSASSLGVEAKGKYTFVVHLERAVPYFNTMLTNPAFYPQSKTAVTKYGKNYGTKSTAILTNGPYTLKNWNGTGDSWTETKNSKYWDAKDVHVKTIKTQVIKDGTTATSLFKSGKLDDVALSGAQATAAKSNKSYNTIKADSTYYLYLNEKKDAIFKNTAARQAISLALNRQGFINSVLKNGSTAAHTVTPQGLSTKPSDTSVDFATDAADSKTTSYTSYNLAKAKKLWAQALKASGQSKVSLTITTDDSDTAKATGEYLQNALQKLPGLTVSLSALPVKSDLAKLSSGDFDISVLAWTADFPDPISFLQLFTTGGAYNFSNWSNSTYDQLIAKSEQADATNATKRYNDLKQAERLLMKEQGIVPLYQAGAAHLTNSALKNAEVTPAGVMNYVGASFK